MTNYYLGINNQRIGPLQIDQLIANGLTPDTMVWRSGMASWKPARELAELAHLFAPQTPDDASHQAYMHPDLRGNYQQPAPLPYQQPYQQPQYQQSQYQQPYQQGPYYGGYQQPQYGFGPEAEQQYSDQYMAAYGYRPQMEFGTAIKTCFNKFVDFKGRARRSEYWWFYLFAQLIGMVTCGLGSIVCLLPMLSVQVRRLHDTGHSAWWAFLPLVLAVIFLAIFIPMAITAENRGSDAMMGTSLVLYIVFWIVMLVIGIIQLVFLCTDSHREPNKYGSSPKYQ